MLTRVQGGTGGGQRMHRRAIPKTGWVCAHGHGNPGFATTCLSPLCRERRPR